MLHLTYSNHTEALAARFAARSASRAHGFGALAPLEVVVPDRNVERFVEREVARQLGVAVNLRFDRLNSFVRRAVEPRELLLGDSLRALVFAALVDTRGLLARPELAPVRAYLDGPDPSPRERDVRRAQLGERISRVFDGYLWSRPALLRAWERESTQLGETPYRDTERWQAALYRWMRARAPDIAPLHDCVELARRAGGPFAGGTFAGGEVHLFALRELTAVLCALFAAVAERADVFIYALNPCEEFWEDVESPREELRRRARRASPDGDDPFGLWNDTDSPLLRAWGRPGRERVRLLDALTDCDFDAAFVDPVETPRDDGPLFARAQPTVRSATLLHALQSDVLRRVPPTPGDPSGPDAASTAFRSSVRVIACPSIRREVETVAADIWHQLEASPGLRFDDFAVLVCGGERERYLATIASVFESAHGLPFSLSEPCGALGGTGIAAAARALLALPLTGLSRADVLGVITHPAVARSVDERGTADTDRWAHLTDELGVFFGVDAADLDGTYMARAGDAVSWEQAFTRIALSELVDSSATDPSIVAIGGRRYVVPPPGPDRESDAQLVRLVRSLTSDARFAGADSTRLELDAWARFCAGMLTTYLRAYGAAEERELERAVHAFNSLVEVDVLLNGEPPARHGYAYVHELLQGRLDSVASAMSAGEGVTVGSLRSWSAIPRRRVFILGLGDGELGGFGSRARDDRDDGGLDLRRARRAPGDVTDSERDRYAFLEALLSARERIVCSYVNHDERADEPVGPSSVLRELLDAIAASGVDPASIHEEVPRHRDEDPAAVDVLEEAAAERRARELGAAGLGLDEDDAREPPARALSRVPPAAGTKNVVVITLADLRRFLDCPLQGWARARLGLRDVDSTDRAALRDEPFAPGRLEQFRVLDDTFVEAVTHPGDCDLETEYRARVELLQARGRWPYGTLAEIQASAHLEILARWRERWQALGPTEWSGRARLERLPALEENATSRTPIDSAIAPVRLDVRAADGGEIEVELRGRTALLRGHGDGSRASVWTSARARAGPRSERGRIERFRDAVRAFVDHAALSASGFWGVSHRVHRISGAERAPALAPEPILAPIDTAAARAWLRDVCEDLIGGTHEYVFPIEAVARLTNRDPSELHGERLVRSTETVLTRLDGGRTRFGPVRRPLEYPLVDPAMAEAIVARRFRAPLHALAAVGDGGDG